MFALLLVGCSSTYHTIRLVNRSDRAIEQVFIYPTGSKDHGASRATLAPNASADVKMKAGNVDVEAVSAKVRIDEKTKERRTASGTIELKGPAEVIFHDSNQPPPPEVRKPNAHAITFRVDDPPPEPDQEMLPIEPDTPAP